MKKNIFPNHAWKHKRMYRYKMSILSIFMRALSLVVYSQSKRRISTQTTTVNIYLKDIFWLSYNENVNKRNFIYGVKTFSGVFPPTQFTR